MSDICALLAIAGLFILTVNWPVLMMLIKATPTTNIYWTLLTSLTLSLDFPFLAAAFSLETELSQNRRKCAVFLVSGLALLLTGIVASCAQMAPHILNPDLDQLTESVYLSTVSFLTSIGVAISLYRLLTNLIVSYIVQEIAENHYSELEIDIFERAADKAQRITWSFIATVVIFLCYITSEGSADDNSCKTNLKYWRFTFFNNGIILLFSAILLFGKQYLQNPITEKVLGYFYLLVYFPFNASWFNQGVGLFKNGIFMECNKNMVVVILDMALYGWTILPGTLFAMGIFFVSVTWLISKAFELLFPSLLQGMDQLNGELDDYHQQRESSIEMIEIRSKKFNPESYRASFVEKEVCAICLDSFASSQSVVSWKQCNHLFHENCIQRWVTQRRTCPLCKIPYSPPCSP